MNDIEKARLGVLKLLIVDSDIVTSTLPKCEKHSGETAGQTHGVCDCIDANEQEKCAPCAAEVAFKAFQAAIERIK